MIFTRNIMLLKKLRIDILQLGTVKMNNVVIATFE